MLGAIIGDILGSTYEKNPIKTKTFEWNFDELFFTDDTVLTVATAYAIMNDVPYAESYKLFYNKYPFAGYGKNFEKWALSESYEPYGSWGNGSAMRVSPVALAYNNLTNILRQAKKSAEVTHNHPDGIKGAKAMAHSIFLARKGFDKQQIKDEIEKNYNYDLSLTVEYYRENANPRDISCQATVPQALVAFLESTDFEDAIRNAISIGVDSDTIAAISGSVAEVYYGFIPGELKEKCLNKLDEYLMSILNEFYLKYKLNF